MVCPLVFLAGTLRLGLAPVLGLAQNPSFLKEPANAYLSPSCNPSSATGIFTYLKRPPISTASITTFVMSEASLQICKIYGLLTLR